MNFKLVECPKCKTKEILPSIYSGTTCKSCKIKILADSIENRKMVRKENAEFAGCFNTNFEDFQKWLKQIETNWSKENCFAEFKDVEIPNNELLDMIK